jgi:hypothetical protein
MDRGNQVLMERVLALSSTMLNQQVDRERPNEMAKTLSEVAKCQILGYCGLSWSEQHLMPTIWTDLKKQRDQASRETVLAAFFDDITDRTEPLLVQSFVNQAFFDDVINHRLTSGDTYDTCCHKGFSLLAFLPRSHKEIAEERTAAENAHYQEANVKTVRKHSTKGPPPIPASDAELLWLNTRDVAVFTAFSPNGVISSSRKSNSRRDTSSSCRRVPEPSSMWMLLAGTTPTITKAGLSGHTMLFLLGTQVNLVGVPQQWLKNANMPGSAKRARHAHGESEPSIGRRGTAAN